MSKHVKTLVGTRLFGTWGGSRIYILRPTRGICASERTQLMKTMPFDVEAVDAIVDAVGALEEHPTGTAA